MISPLPVRSPCALRTPRARAWQVISGYSWPLFERYNIAARRAMKACNRCGCLGDTGSIAATLEVAELSNARPDLHEARALAPRDRREPRSRSGRERQWFSVWHSTALWRSCIAKSGERRVAAPRQSGRRDPRRRDMRLALHKTDSLSRSAAPLARRQSHPPLPPLGACARCSTCVPRPAQIAKKAKGGAITHADAEKGDCLHWQPVKPGYASINDWWIVLLYNTLDALFPAAG